MRKMTPAFRENGAQQHPAAVHVSADPIEVSAADSLPAAAIDRQFQNWLYECHHQQHSERTVEFRCDVGKKLVWFLAQEGCTHCGTTEIRRFLTHVTDGHKEPGGAGAILKCAGLCDRPPVTATLGFG